MTKPQEHTDQQILVQMVIELRRENLALKQTLKKVSDHVSLWDHKQDTNMSQEETVKQCLASASSLEQNLGYAHWCGYTRAYNKASEAVKKIIGEFLK